MYKAGACIRYSRLDLFIIKQWPSLPLVPKPMVQGRKWPGRAFTGIRRTRNYTCWLLESYSFTVACWTRTPVLHFPLIEPTAALLSLKRLHKKLNKRWFAGTNSFCCASKESDFVLWKTHGHRIAENSFIYDRSQNISSSHICTSTGKWNLSYTWPERRVEILTLWHQWNI